MKKLIRRACAAGALLFAAMTSVAASGDLSKDGRVFTFHDDALTRTAGGANTNKCSDIARRVFTCCILPIGSCT